MKKLTQYTAIDWMHPSWRDLVIDHLVADDNARRRFLRHCGLEGFLLALSSAGGATGERRRPLLRNQPDWTELRGAVRRIIESDSSSILSVLAMLYENLRAHKQGDSQHPPAKHLVDLTTEALEVIRNRWTKKGVDSADLLERYYSISELLPALPGGPDLRPTWKAYRQDALAEIKRLDALEFEFFVGCTNEWLKLAVTINANEPRFLRQVGFVSNDGPIFVDLLPALQERAELEFDFDDADECRDEQSTLESLAKLADNIVRLFPSVGQSAGRVAFKARVNERRAEARRERFEQDWEPDEDDRERFTDTTPPGALSEDDADDSSREPSVSVNDLFADL